MDKRKKTKNIKSMCYDVDPDKLVFFEQFDVTMARSENELTSNDTEDEDEDQEGEETLTKILGKTAGYTTPAGIIQIPEFSDGSKQFKFWTMHLKIKLTQRLEDEINNVEGVESYEQYTPYRARISVAPLFVDNIVLNKIKQVIKNYASSKIKNSKE